jgi:hypothetical protein
MPALPLRWVLVRAPHEAFEPHAVLGTDLMVDPLQILAWFVLRWHLEVTWQAARAHLGMETPRPWNAQAIARTTLALLGLVSMITLWAGQGAQEHARPIRQAVWSRQVQPTVAAAMAVVRQHVWISTHVDLLPAKPDMVKIPSTLLNRLTESLCDAA